MSTVGISVCMKLKHIKFLLWKCMPVPIVWGTHNSRKNQMTLFVLKNAKYIEAKILYRIPGVMFAYHIHVLYLFTTEDATGIFSCIGSTKWN